MAKTAVIIERAGKYKQTEIWIDGEHIVSFYGDISQEGFGYIFTSLGIRATIIKTRDPEEYLYVIDSLERRLPDTWGKNITRHVSYYEGMKFESTYSQI